MLDIARKNESKESLILDIATMGLQTKGRESPHPLGQVSVKYHMVNFFHLEDISVIWKIFLSYGRYFCHMEDISVIWGDLSAMCLFLKLLDEMISQRLDQKMFFKYNISTNYEFWQV